MTLRRIALTVVAAVLGLGLVGLSAPAHADTSWGYSIRPR